MSPVRRILVVNSFFFCTTTTKLAAYSTPQRCILNMPFFSVRAVTLTPPIIPRWYDMPILYRSFGWRRHCQSETWWKFWNLDGGGMMTFRGTTYKRGVCMCFVEKRWEKNSRCWFSNTAEHSCERTPSSYHSHSFHTHLPGSTEKMSNHKSIARKVTSQQC